MLSDDIADFLTTGGMTSSKIYIGELPERPIEALVITPTGGLGATRTMEALSNNASIEDVRVQVRARSSDGAGGYAAAEQLMVDAHTLLRGMAERTINGRRYYTIVALQTPYYIGRDEENRPTFACNYQILRAESTA